MSGRVCMYVFEKVLNNYFFLPMCLSCAFVTFEKIESADLAVAEVGSFFFLTVFHLLSGPTNDQ